MPPRSGTDKTLFLGILSALLNFTIVVYLDVGSEGAIFRAATSRSINKGDEK
jgi:hypothetical protein